jgi:hypothetical protein
MVRTLGSPSGFCSSESFVDGNDLHTLSFVVRPHSLVDQDVTLSR